MSLARTLKALVDAEVSRDTDVADVVRELLVGVAYALLRAGHTNIDNMAAQLGAIIAQAVSEGAES